jgi:RimJ/RimL family protein N-acetyltransferase
MNPENLSVREITAEDIPHIISYWQNATPEYLHGMGVVPAYVPDFEQWHAMLSGQILSPYEKKQSYCIILMVDGEPIGHSNINKIIFGKEAYMHLHIWRADLRKTGIGSKLVRMAIPYFFKNMQLETLYCEPYTLNPAPNKTLEKLGFEWVKEYVTVPGTLNFEQPVNLWQMTRAHLETL